MEPGHEAEAVSCVVVAVVNVLPGQMESAADEALTKADFMVIKHARFHRPDILLKKNLITAVLSDLKDKGNSEMSPLSALGHRSAANG